LKFDLGANARRQALEGSGGAATGTLTGTVTVGDAALADAWSSASVAELDAGVEYSKPFSGAGTIAKMPGTYPVISSLSLSLYLSQTHTRTLSHTHTLPGTYPQTRHVLASRHLNPAVVDAPLGGGEGGGGGGGGGGAGTTGGRMADGGPTADCGLKRTLSTPPPFLAPPASGRGEGAQGGGNVQGRGDGGCGGVAGGGVDEGRVSQGHGQDGQMALEVEVNACEAQSDGEVRRVNENAGLNGRQGDDYGKDICWFIE